ncbi:unnamed protein product [Paramecium sonneborni]|uniref:Uncharacterized protein n=1 Tax=Paramecium sonneborni TaxID=65129 RepID=A0A8S1QZP8_9CILI|nr:unnamed protein product [Paramecium sonneborni]
MSYQQKGLNAIRLTQMNSTILKARKSQEYSCELSQEYLSRNNLLKQNRAISQHYSRLIIEDEFQKMKRPQTSEGSRRKKKNDFEGIQVNQNSNTKCEILECENEDDKEEQGVLYNQFITCNPRNRIRNDQNQVPFQTALDQDFLNLFAND